MGSIFPQLKFTELSLSSGTVVNTVREFPHLSLKQNCTVIVVSPLLVQKETSPHALRPQQRAASLTARVWRQPPGPEARLSSLSGSLER